MISSLAALPSTALIPRSRSSSTRVREVSTTTSGIPWAISFSPSRLPTRPKPTNSAWLQISTGTLLLVFQDLFQRLLVEGFGFIEIFFQQGKQHRVEHN
ncbi:Uncharacterised protein [Klebsiella pneumoniae]|uniref:Uncharacterized protein n=1 Tax=Klebsiella pneumoniae TaxID=573 RepID=A0A2X3H4N0_KLEPN|nr:Uncharacterised protein [Klebsiella pneumoniae]